MDLYVRQFGLQTHDQFYTNPSILNSFMNFTTQVVSRYVNSPAVFSWELANDPRFYTSTTKDSYVADPLEILGVIPPSLQARAVRRRPSHNGTLLWRLIFAPLTLTTSFPLGECGSFFAKLGTSDNQWIIHDRTSGFMCTDCPKLYPLNPAPAPAPTASPAPGKRKRSKPVPVTTKQILRERAESRRRNREAARLAGTLKQDGIRIRGRWVSTSKLCKYSKFMSTQL